MYNHPQALLCILVVFSLCLFSQLKPLPIDNSLEENVLHDENLNQYATFHEAFGNDRILIGALPCEELNKAILTSLFELEQKLLATGHLKKVLSPVSLLKDLSSIDTRKDLDDWFNVEGNIEGFREKLRLISVANNQVISFERRTVGIVLILNDEYRYTDISVIAELKAIIESSDLFSQKFIVTGVPDIIRVIYNFTRFSQRVFSPATLILMAIMLYFLYKTPFGIIVPLTAVIIPLLWLLSFFNIFSRSANFITTMVPPLMLGIAMTSCIHIVTAYLFLSASEEEFNPALVVQAIKEQFTPVMLCQVTTFLGFFTLAANGIGAVRDYGLFAALGIILILVSVFVLLPVLILLGKVTKQKQTGVMTADAYFKRLSTFVIQRRWAIIIVSIALAAGCVTGLRLMTVETSVLRHLPQDHTVIRDIKYIEQKLGGIVPVHIVLEYTGPVEHTSVTLTDETTIPVSVSTPTTSSSTAAVNLSVQGIPVTTASVPVTYETTTVTRTLSVIDTKKSLATPEIARKIYHLQQKLEKLEYVDSTVSWVNFVQDYDRIFSEEEEHIPPSSEEIVDYLDFFRPGSGDYDHPVENPAESPVDRFLTRDYRTANIALRIRDVGSLHFNRIFEMAREYLKEAEFSALSVDTYITGRAYLWVLTSQIIAWNQLINFLLALTIICLVIIIYFRSVLVGLMSLIPNVLPLAIIYGVMGYMGIHLNTLTGMIACVAIGMNVDDTIHFIYAYREYITQGVSPEDAVYKSMLKKGSSMVFTTLVIIAGFSVLMLSDFPPTLQFGACISFTFAMALALDLLLTPALLLVITPFQRETGDMKNESA